MLNQNQKERLKFWVTCPECGHKFGVDTDTVFKYMDRVLEDLTKRLKDAGKDFGDEGEEEGS